MNFWPFRRRTTFQIPFSPTKYPSGVCVSTEVGHYYIKGNKRYAIPTDRVLRSWAFPHIVMSSKEAVSEYPLGGKLGFREGTLINDLSSGKLYVISGNKRCQITDPDTLDVLQVSRKDFVTVSRSETNLHEEGPAFDDI